MIVFFQVIFSLFALFFVPRQRTYCRHKNFPFIKSTTFQPMLVSSSGFSFSGGAMTCKSSERRAMSASASATITETAMTMILIGHTISSCLWWLVTRSKSKRHKKKTSHTTTTPHQIQIIQVMENPANISSEMSKFKDLL